MPDAGIDLSTACIVEVEVALLPTELLCLVIESVKLKTQSQTQRIIIRVVTLRVGKQHFRARIGLSRHQRTHYHTSTHNISKVMRKPDFCICKNKGTDQLRCYHAADQCLCFRYIVSTTPLLSKSEILSL